MEASIKTEQSPLITSVKWGEMTTEVKLEGKIKDWMLWPGGGCKWNRRPKGNETMEQRHTISREMV